jgi:cell division septum initiation protein DivIVA
MINQTLLSLNRGYENLQKENKRLKNRVEELEKENENYKKTCASWEALESYGREEANRYKQALKWIVEFSEDDLAISKAREALEVNP